MDSQSREHAVTEPASAAPAGPPTLVSVETLAAWLHREVPADAPPPPPGSEAFASVDSPLGTRNIVLLDVRWSVPAGGADHDAYLRGHLPGAVYVSMDGDLAGLGGPRDGRHPLPSADAFAETVQRWGVDDGDTVVVYDDCGGTSAARAWWLLRHAGIRSSLVLDGGLAAWREEGLALQAGEVIPVPGSARTSWGRMPVVDADGAEVVAEAGLLLDARAPDRYRGETEPLDPVAGHIPGAVNLPTAGNLDDDGRLLPVDRLAERFDAVDAAAGVDKDAPVAVYCGSGVTAAHQVMAMAVAGRHGVALFPGSWSAWCTDPDRPVATGPEPGGR
ncbi:sulfurtransferase [Micrococcus luteus]